MVATWSGVSLKHVTAARARVSGSLATTRSGVYGRGH